MIGSLAPERRQALFSEVDLQGMNERIDLGAPFTETIYGAAEEYPGWRDEIRIWHDRWIEMTSPAIDHSVRLQRALRKNGVPVFALSNFGIESFDIAAAQYPFLDEFDRRYISGHMKVIKPDPTIYEMVEVDSGIAPEALLFADDRANNIDVAASRGWQTHLFQNAKGWAEALVSHGLLSAQEAV